MKNFLLGLIVGLALFLMAAAQRQPKKAVGISNQENMFYVLYDDGSVYGNQGMLAQDGYFRVSPNPWVCVSKGVADDAVIGKPWTPQ